MAEVFPAFIRAEYDPSGNGFPAFERAAEQATASVRSRFEADFADIQRTVQRALAVPRNAGGSLDLGVDEQRAAAAAAEARAIAAREVAVATRAAAQAEGDYSQRARLAIAAANALEVETRQEAAAALAHAGALEQVQTQLNRTASATKMMVVQAGHGTTAFGAVTNSTRSMRFAGVMAGQQLQDMVIQFQAGTRASTIFAQQVPQLAFAFSGLEGAAGSMSARVGRIARFMSGPWGAALIIGGLALSALTRQFLDNEKAAKAAELGADGLADAQSALGKIFDLTTGKLKTQNELLLLNARLTAINLRGEAQKEESRSRDILTRSARTPSTALVSANQGVLQMGATAFDRDAPVRQLALRAQRAQAIKDEKERAELFDQILQDTEKVDFSRSGIDVNKFRQAIIDRASSAAKRATADFIDKSLKDGKLAPELQRDRSGSGGRASTAVLDATAKLNAADDPVEQARARLALVKAQNRELLAQGKISRDLYLSRVQAAEEEVQAAERINETGKALTKAQKEAQRLADFGDRAAEKIAKIGAKFDDQPRDIDRARLATAKLDDIIKDLERRKPPGFEKLIADAERAKTLIPEALGKPFRDMIEQQERQIEIQAALNAGREGEADQLQLIYRLMDMTGTESVEQLASALALRGIHAEDFEQLVHNLGVMREQTREMEVQRERQRIYLNALYDVERSIQQGIAGLRTKGFDSIKDMIAGFGRTYDNLIADYVTEKVFGPTFRALRDEIEGKSPITQANEKLASDVGDASAQFDRAGDAARSLADALLTAEARIASKTGGFSVPGVAANDNAGGSYVTDTGEIVVTAHRSPVGQNFPDPTQFLAHSFATLIQKGLGISDDAAKKISGALRTALEGAAIGQVAGGLILGKSGDRTGEALGGIVGNFAGKAIGATLGKLGGSIGGPIGSAVGGVLGGLVGGLFKSKKEASSTLIINNGEAYGATPIGKGSQEKNAAQSLANDLGSALERIADQLGGTLGRARVSVGYRPGHKAGPYRVDPTGAGGVAGGPVVAFDEEEDALRYAIIDALKDGAIEGIREGTKRLLRAGQDLDTALNKALSFEQVFKDLKKYEDPVGAALDTLNAKFEKLKSIFKEAGASAEEYADLEKLYGHERADAIKQASAQALDSLKSLLHDLTIGDSGKSLRDRIAAAKAVYDPLAADVAAGKTVDADAFTQAARDLLDVERQYSGSQDDYFALLDEVTSLTQKALTAQQDVIDAATGANTPFDSKPIVDATDRSAQTIVDGIAGALAPRLDAVNDNIGRLIGSGGSAVGARLFALDRLNY